MRRSVGAAVVSGPGLPEAGIRYDSDGPALSRALTAACKATGDGDWYVHVGDRIVARASRTEASVTCERLDP